MLEGVRIIVGKGCGLGRRLQNEAAGQVETRESSYYQQEPNVGDRGGKSGLGKACLNIPGRWG